MARTDRENIEDLRGQLVAAHARHFRLQNLWMTAALMLAVTVANLHHEIGVWLL